MVNSWKYLKGLVCLSLQCSAKSPHVGVFWVWVLPELPRHRSRDHYVKIPLLLAVFCVSSDSCHDTVVLHLYEQNIAFPLEDHLTEVKVCGTYEVQYARKE